MKLPKGLVLRKGVFQIVLQIDGQRIRRSLGIPASEFAAAKAIYDELMVEIARGKAGLISRKDPLLRTLFDNYLAYKQNIVTEQTYEQVEHWFRDVIEKTGTEAASDLSAQTLMIYLNARAQRQPNTAKKIQVQVIAAFDHAVTLGLVDANPLKSMARIKHICGRKEPLTEQQFIAFSMKASKYSCGSLIFFLMHTGCRFGEAQKLQWKDVHLETGYVVFVKENTKTKKRREVPLSEDIQILMGQLLKLNPQPEDHVFKAESGKPFIKDNVRRVVKAIGRQIGRPDLTTHGLRGTFINMAFDKDANPYAVRAIVGHANVSTTQIYEKPNLARSRKVISIMPHIKTA
jgi:integrase